MVHTLVNTYTKLLEPVTVQYVFFMGFGGAKLKDRPGQPTL